MSENGFAIPPDEDGKLSDFSSIDALIEIQEVDNFQRIVQDEIDKLRLSEREAFDVKWTKIIPELTEKDLDVLWNQKLMSLRRTAYTWTIDRLEFNRNMEESKNQAKEHPTHPIFSFLH